MFQVSKLKIREGQKLLLIQPPENFDLFLGNAFVFEETSNVADAHVVIWFVKGSAELNFGVDNIVREMQPMATLWICYPKKSSGIETDFSRDHGWDAIESRTDIRFLTLISLSDIWSAFAMRKEGSKIRAKREIENWSDTTTKHIVLPQELKAKFDDHPQAKVFFDQLAFTYKREYVDWIVSAKKKETKDARLSKMMELLIQHKKTR